MANSALDILNDAMKEPAKRLSMKQIDILAAAQLINDIASLKSALAVAGKMKDVTINTAGATLIRSSEPALIAAVGAAIQARIAVAERRLADLGVE